MLDRWHAVGPISGVAMAEAADPAVLPEMDARLDGYLRNAGPAGRERRTTGATLAQAKRAPERRSACLSNERHGRSGQPIFHPCPGLWRPPSGSSHPLLALERTAFMRLMKTGATLAPIEHMLATAACCNRRAARATDAADRKSVV